MKKVVLLAAVAMTAMTFAATAPASALELNVGVGTPHRAEHRSVVRVEHRPMVRRHVIVEHHERHRPHAKLIVVKHRH